MSGNMHIRTLATTLLNLSLACAPAWAEDMPAFTPERLESLDHRDSELFSGILGAWYFESMGRNFTHVAQRTVYFENCTFVSDFRISNAGSVRYRRATGVWNPVMEWFFEEETQSTDDRLIPRMIRWLGSVSDKELKTRSRTNMEAALVRGPQPSNDFDSSLNGLSEKELIEALTGLGMVGFIPNPTGKQDNDGKPLYKWVLKSKLVPAETE